MAEKNVLGENEILFIYGPIKDAEGGNVAANYFPIGCLTTNSITTGVDMKEGTITKCNKSPDPSYGRKNSTVTFEAVNVEDDGLKASYDSIIETMNDAVDNKKYVYFKIETTLSDGTTKKTKFGKGFLTQLDRTAPADGEVTYNGSITVSGSLSNTDLHV